MLFESLELLWELRITNLVRVDIGDANAHAMFHLAFAETVQKWLPMFVFFQIFGDVFGDKNVSGISAIHHPLRHVEASAREIGMTIHVNHAAHRAAVDTHPKL